LAYWSLRVLGTLAPAGISGQVIRFGPAVATLTLLETLGTGVAIAGMQELALRRIRRESLLDSGSALTTRPSSRLLGAMVVAEIAIAVVVVVSGGLLVRNFVRLQRTDPGFRADRVLVLSCDLEDLYAAGGATVDRDGRVGALLSVMLERA